METTEIDRSLAEAQSTLAEITRQVAALTHTTIAAMDALQTVAGDAQVLNVSLTYHRNRHNAYRNAFQITAGALKALRINAGDRTNEPEEIVEIADSALERAYKELPGDS